MDRWLAIDGLVVVRAQLAFASDQQINYHYIQILFWIFKTHIGESCESHFIVYVERMQSNRFSTNAAGDGHRR